MITRQLNINEILLCDSIVRSLVYYSDAYRELLLSRGESIGTFKKRRFIDVSNDYIVSHNMQALADDNLFAYVNKQLENLGYTLKAVRGKKGTLLQIRISLNQIIQGV